MDTIDDVDDVEPLEVRSEGVTASVGEKRAADNGESEVRLLKKGKRLYGNVKRVAEIVLVLTTMGKMRGGRTPTPAEVEMMAEARDKLVEVCQGFAPKDVFPRDAFGTVIEDLGLSKIRDQMFGLRPPKMSIAEKLKLTKQKMEKSEEFAIRSATYSSQRLQTHLGSAAESCGTSHAIRIFSSEKPSEAPTSSGGFQPVAPSVHVSAAKSAPLSYQLPTSEVRPVVSSGLPSSHPGKDSSSLALPRAESPHFRLDVKSNGASYASQAQANSSGDQTKTPTWSVQPLQSASSAKTVSNNKGPVHASVKVEGAADMSRLVPQAATSIPFICQTTSVNLPSVHQHIQHGVKFVQAPSLSNSHCEIGKIVQKLLKPQLPEHPIWTPPSRDYMSKALACLMCKLIIDEVDNVLVCDACEKGYHLNCLLFHNQKLVPRGEWHCGKCLSLSNGKPLTPKYGRVTRNTTAPKLSSNATTVQSSSEKKVGTLDGKVNLQTITANGNSVIQSAPTGTMDNKYSHLAAGVEMADVRVMQRNNTLSVKGKEIDEHPSGSDPNNLVKISAAACATPVNVSVQRSYEEKLIAESKSQTAAKSETLMNAFNHSQASGHPQDNDQSGTTISEKPSKRFSDTNFIVQIKKSCGEKFSECNTHDATKQNEQGVSLANHVETPGTSIGPREHAGSLSDGLHDVDWIGDISHVVDAKTYYQSCCINGFVYKVSDHALFRSNNSILTPFKLQHMWEDSKTRLKWVIASRCYFPADLPEAVGRPCAPEINEVYESNHDSTVRAGFIEGPCEVLPPRPFMEERERRIRLGMEESVGLRPIFVCKWFFDEPKGLFRDVTS